MKICNSEAMKLIKELEKEKNTLIFFEQQRCYVLYKEGENKVPTDYDYFETRKKIAKIDDRVRLVKHKLAEANCVTIIDEFNITIGEALVYVAQLNAEHARLEALVNRKKLERRITPNGVIEYTECLYDPDKVLIEQKELYSKIGRLQVAIDRANLTTFIEI